jgi:hypothetical protein
MTVKLRYFYVDGGIHPVVGQVYHWQAEAIGNGDVSRYTRYICEVLSAVAQTSERCQFLLCCVNKIEDGRERQIETGGNDVTLTLSRAGVQVDIDINDDWVGQSEGHFTLDEWRVALEGWRRFLEMPYSLESVIEIEL